MVTLTYPGVYTTEIPSGVRTIAGVGTSIAMFLGRARRGPIDKPIRCLSLDDFDRAFSLKYADSDLARAVRLFFLNGGTECFVQRIARNADPAAITLRNEAGADTLRLKARSVGPEGNDIRARVDYNTTSPETTFNLEVFRWERTSGGTLLKRDAELYQAVNMDPNSPRYVQAVVNADSSLVEATDLNAAPLVTLGFSISGRAIPAVSFAIFQAQCAALFGNAAGVAGNRMRVSVNGNPFVLIDMSTANVAAMVGFNDVTNAFKAAIEGADPTVIVNVTLANGPAGQALAGGAGEVPGPRNNASRYLRIESNAVGGEVRIESAPTDDLARVLMLGPTFGGIERSAHAGRRPAANGIVFDIGATLANYVTFAARSQTFLDDLHITTPGAGIQIVPLTGASNLATLDVTKVPVATIATASAKMFQDRNTDYAGVPPKPDPATDGVREKFAIIAAAINATRGANPTFPWTAELWGSRFALVPAVGVDNLTATVAARKAAVVVAGALPVVANTRYYSLGTSGATLFQTGGVAGTPGIAPDAGTYDAAYKIIDREIDLFNLMVLPRDAQGGDALLKTIWGPASVFCAQRRAMLLMDPPSDWKDHNDAVDLTKGIDTLRIGLVKDHSAIFFPDLSIVDEGLKVNVGPSGAAAGVMARIDATRGVWKAAAGTDADIRGVVGVKRRFSDLENGVMNPKGVNTIRVFPAGIVNWGARTMDGDDAFGSENKYIPIRRTANHILLSLQRGLQWVVFQPNDEPLWAQIRLNVGAFMHDLFRQGAFQGATPRDAYFVRCDSSTTTQSDRNLGVVNILVGFAPLKPAEFVVLQLQQMAGQIEV
jgi:uncharacterized protein